MADYAELIEVEAEGVVNIQTAYEMGGGIVPSGTKNININSNGVTTEDVTEYASAKITVNVPEPSGTINITTNGTHNVKNYANANVNVPSSGITPTGTKEIEVDAAGTITEDVTEYANVEITVPQGSASTPAFETISVTPTISISGRTITAVVNASKNITPSVTEGWVSEGNANRVSASGSNTAQIPSEFIIPTGKLTINQNGTDIDVSQYASVDVLVSGGGGNIGPILDGSVTSVSESTITKLHHSVFRGCNQLTSVDLPNVTTLGSYDFYQCTSLSTVKLPKVSNGQASSFYGCSALQSIILPSAERIENNCFQLCTSLAIIDLKVCNRLGGNAFNGCSSLNTLILRNSSVCALASTNVFTNTPFASGGTGGTIYVPSALISSYQSATNWSTIHGYGTITWKAIEGSQYENYYADGTPIT